MNNQPGIMKTPPGTIKNLENRPGTMKNPPGTMMQKRDVTNTGPQPTSMIEKRDVTNMGPQPIFWMFRYRKYWVSHKNVLIEQNHNPN